ncbi:MAG: 4Fe-4S binding protein [Spirochaetales bacterium]|nr:4Fe-4S binding protein [Spirochaetales bacterium]
MILGRLRFLIQSVSFFVLMYGGRIGLHLGYFLPCFACPYVGSCAGHCYLMAFQGPFWGLQIPFVQFLSTWGLRALAMFFGFILFVILLNKTWCGWICPFGTLQDWITGIRKKMGIRESQFSWKVMDLLTSIKYILLILLILIPVCIANTGLHKDFELFFCQICPAKILLPLFNGNISYFAMDFTNTITMAMTISALILCAGLLAGCFFKDRFFCLFCPLLAFISLFKKIGFIRLEKNTHLCTGCANCMRVCPVDAREVYMEKEKSSIRSPECIQCFKCVEACPRDNTLKVKFLKWTLYSSSKENAVIFFKRKKVAGKKRKYNR